MSPDQLEILRCEASRLDGVTLRVLLADANRCARFQHRAGPILLDISKQRIDDVAVGALGTFLESADWTSRRDAMFAGEIINTSEHRAVLHTALRGNDGELPDLAPSTVRREIQSTLQRVTDLVDALHGEGTGRLGIPDGITDVINVGIGGSDLGPRLAVEALAPYHAGKLKCHFLPNVDGHATAALLRQLDPRRCLVLLVSKSFTTQETQLNAAVLREWMTAAYAQDSEAAARHFIAISANLDAAANIGIPPQRVLPMWDFVGGRYSVWSAVGLVVALAIGMENFRAFLAGAAEMDAHFREANWQQNLPVLLALVGVWNRNALGLPTQAVIPYDDRLRELPAFLQQLEMESLGKSVRADGVAVTQATGPVVWGSVGTNAQHAFFQSLHQGTDVVPVDFIGVVQPAHALAGNHAALLANLLAQGAALALGKTVEEAYAEASSGSLEERAALSAQRTFSGNRPSTTLLLDALTPHSLGMMLAMYEHKVFVQSLLWEINAFDQWGVELGKSLASGILPALQGGALPRGIDASTQALIAAITTRRSA